MAWLLTIINLLLLAFLVWRGLKLLKEIRKSMATQEQRLQNISAKIDEVLSDLANLKTNNPEIEDEIAAIEAKLSLAQPPDEEPAPEGGEVV
jgi:cytochrome c-type biogenesis protein CcmH/NrfG